MKKKFILLIIVLAMLATCVVMLTACNSNDYENDNEHVIGLRFFDPNVVSQRVPNGAFRLTEKGIESYLIMRYHLGTAVFEDASLDEILYNRDLFLGRLIAFGIFSQSQEYALIYEEMINVSIAFGWMSNPFNFSRNGNFYLGQRLGNNSIRFSFSNNILNIRIAGIFEEQHKMVDFQFEYDQSIEFVGVYSSWGHPLLPPIELQVHDLVWRSNFITHGARIEIKRAGTDTFETMYAASMTGSWNKVSLADLGLLVGTNTARITLIGGLSFLGDEGYIRVSLDSKPKYYEIAVDSILHVVSKTPSNFREGEAFGTVALLWDSNHSNHRALDRVEIKRYNSSIWEFWSYESLNYLQLYGFIPTGDDVWDLDYWGWVRLIMVGDMVRIISQATTTLIDGVLTHYAQSAPAYYTITN